MPRHSPQPFGRLLEKHERRHEDDVRERVERREHEPNQPHVVIERKPRASGVFPRQPDSITNAFRVRGEIAVRELHSFRPRRAAGRELQKRRIGKRDALGIAHAIVDAEGGDGDDRAKLSIDERAENGANLRRRDERRRAGAAQNMSRVLEIIAEPACAQRRIHRHRHETGVHAAEKTGDELDRVGKHERDAIAFPQAVPLQRRGVARGRRKHFRERQKSVARFIAKRVAVMRITIRTPLERTDDRELQIGIVHAASFPPFLMARKQSTASPTV